MWKVSNSLHEIWICHLEMPVVYFRTRTDYIWRQMQKILFKWFNLNILKNFLLCFRNISYINIPSFGRPQTIEHRSISYSLTESMFSPDWLHYLTRIRCKYYRSRVITVTSISFKGYWNSVNVPIDTGIANSKEEQYKRNAILAAFFCIKYVTKHACVR